MMLGRSRIAIAVVLVATELTKPAHSQLPDGLRLLPERPSQEQIDYLRDLTIKAARMAVQDDAAKVEITTLVVGVDYPPGVIVEHYTQTAVHLLLFEGPTVRVTQRRGVDRRYEFVRFLAEITAAARREFMGKS